MFTLEGVGKGVGSRRGEGEGPPRCPVLFERKTQIQSKRLFFFLSFSVQPSVSLILNFSKFVFFSESPSRSECILTVKCCELVFCYDF